MLRIVLTFGVALLAVPAVGIFLSTDLANEGTHFLRAPSAAAARALCVRVAPRAPDAAHYACEFVSSARVIELGFLGTVVAMALLLAGYAIAVSTLAHPRDRLARYFPIVIRASLVTLVLVFFVQGALLLWILSERVIAQRPGGAMMIALVGAGLIAAAILIAWSWRELLTVEPLEVTGILIGREQLPELWSRIDRLATHLGAAPPKQLILGLEPTAFVTATDIELRSVGRLPAIETLYLPLCGLRIWNDAELDSVIGHELGHFRGEDLRYSARFIPAFRSLVVSLESLQVDAQESAGWFRAARLPAVLVLSAMLSVFHHLVSRVSRERELAADLAAANVSSGAALLSALGKIAALTAEWQDFWGALAHFITFGRTRVNFCEDLLDRAAAFRESVSPELFTRGLLASQQPHPLDSHPPLAVRAAALGIDAAPILEASIASLSCRSQASPALRGLEETLTQAITERIRVPGGPLSVDLTPGLPGELARRVP